MELRDRRHGRDAVPAQLRQLLAPGRVDVDEAVHVADAEALDRVRRAQLPLGAQAGRVLAKGRGECKRKKGRGMKTHIVTHRPVWLLCLITLDGAISRSVSFRPGAQAPMSSNVYTLTVSS